MASKEFEIAARSRYLIYRELQDGRKQRVRANINLHPRGALQITPVCRRRGFPPPPSTSLPPSFFLGLSESWRAIVGESAPFDTPSAVN